MVLSEVQMSQNRLSEVRTSRTESGQEQRLFTFKATQLIWLGLFMLEALIALRIGLKLIGANPENSFAAFTYGLSHIFLFPFEGLIATPTSGGLALELSSFIAMVVYALLAWALERIVWLVFYRPQGTEIGITQTRTSEPMSVVQSTTTTSEPMSVVQSTIHET
jgi:hypothetical protein